MSAYVISEVDVRDAAGFEAYRTIAAEAIAHYGGRYLVARRRSKRGRRRPAAEDTHRRRISFDGAPARMVRLAGIRRGARCGEPRWTAA